MHREPEWMQRCLDAMRDTLDVDSALKQQMIDFLFAEGFWDSRRLGAAAARTRFNACLNPGKPDFFKLSELWALMKRFRRYGLLYAMLDDMGFERPRQLPTRLRRDELARQIAALRQTQEEALAELEHQLTLLDDAAVLEEPAERLRVHPAMREPGPRFSADGDEWIPGSDNGGHAPGGC